MYDASSIASLGQRREQRANKYSQEAMQRRMQLQRKKRTLPVGSNPSSENDQSKFGTYTPGISSFSRGTRRSF